MAERDKVIQEKEALIAFLQDELSYLRQDETAEQFDGTLEGMKKAIAAKGEVTLHSTHSWLQINK